MSRSSSWLREPTKGRKDVLGKEPMVSEQGSSSWYAAASEVRSEAEAALDSAQRSMISAKDAVYSMAGYAVVKDDSIIVQSLDPERAKQARRDSSRSERSAMVAKYGLSERPPPRDYESERKKLAGVPVDSGALNKEDCLLRAVPRQRFEGGVIDEICSSDFSDLFA